MSSFYPRPPGSGVPAGAGWAAAAWPPRALAPSTTSLPASSAARQARRWILPLEVLGMVPARSSTTCCTCARLADRVGDRLDGAGVERRVVGGALVLVHHDQPLLIPDLDREGRAAARAQRRVGPLDRKFDVLRIKIAAADDDQVLEPAGDEQLATVEEAEIAGAQKRLRFLLALALGRARA